MRNAAHLPIIETPSSCKHAPLTEAIITFSTTHTKSLCLLQREREICFCLLTSNNSIKMFPTKDFYNSQTPKTQSSCLTS